MRRFLLAALLIPVSALPAPAKLLLEQGPVVVALVAASGFLVSNLTLSMSLLLPLALLSWAAVSLAVPPPAWAA
jgi:hypothetical protein